MKWFLCYDMGFLKKLVNRSLKGHLHHLPSSVASSRSPKKLHMSKQKMKTNTSKSILRHFGNFFCLVVIIIILFITCARFSFQYTRYSVMLTRKYVRHLITLPPNNNNNNNTIYCLLDKVNRRIESAIQ